MSRCLECLLKYSPTNLGEFSLHLSLTYFAARELSNWTERIRKRQTNELLEKNLWRRGEGIHSYNLQDTRLYSQCPQVYLIDYGLAKHFRDSNFNHIRPANNGGSITGTVRYTSIHSHTGGELS